MTSHKPPDPPPSLEAEPDPNPRANDLLHVERFGVVWALVETLGVISLHRTQEEAEAALAAEIERRAVMERARGQ